eukprot:07709_1
MGQEGIDKFFEAHKCNDICRYLNLPSTAQHKIFSPDATRIAPPRPQQAAGASHGLSSASTRVQQLSQLPGEVGGGSRSGG